MADIKTETLTYDAGGATLESCLAYDASASGKRPGIVVFGEWWGLNDYLKGRARQLAELGYVALAADVYGHAKQAADADEAGKLMNGLFADMAATTERIKAAVTTLAHRPEVDGSRMGAMGYCLGGALSLHAARIGLDLKGVASFHGSLGKTHPANPGDVKAKVLVCHGADDKFISDEELAGFKQEMQALGVDLEFKSYPGALHGFTNPGATANGEKYGLPLKYDESADRQSWNDMKAFWKRVFG
ncbi:MAG TPA: dienelactone hydrolase family protein [Steroidobacteraceae bacterium]|nr:dienelactone hydrolase family protein [Steroidobacteraceae bacterium]